MTTSIIINQNDGRIEATAVGAETTFPYDFPVFNASHLTVFQVTTDDPPTINTLVLNTHYTVTGVGLQPGAGTLEIALTTAAFPTGATAGEKFIIEQNVPESRLSDFAVGGDFLAETLNQDLDQIVQQAQQLRRDLDRTVSFDKDITLADFSLPRPTADRFLAWSSDATALVNKAGTGTITGISEVSEDTTPTLGGDLNGNNNTVTNLNVLATSSTTARNLETRFDEIINVKDYGALGNGVTDDSAAIQAAIDRAEVIGGRMYMPPGIYAIETGLTFEEEGMMLEGASGFDLELTKGTIIKATASMTNMMTFGTSSRDSVIKDIMFDGNALATTGVRFNAPKGIADHVFATKCTGQGFFLNSFTIRLLHCGAFQNTGHGITLLGGSGLNETRIFGGICSGNSKNGIFCDVSAASGLGLYISYVNMENNCSADDGNAYAHVNIGNGWKRVFISNMYHESDVTPSNLVNQLFYKIGSGCPLVSIKDVSATCSVAAEFDFHVEAGSASQISMDNCMWDNFNTAGINNDVGASGSLVVSNPHAGTGLRYDDALADSGTKLHTIPNQCATRAMQTSGPLTVSGTLTKVPLNTTDYDPASQFSDANDSIIVKEDGIYQINASVRIIAVANGTKATLNVKKDATIIAGHVVTNGSGGADDIQLIVSTCAELADGEAITMEVDQDGGGTPATSAADSRTYLEVVKISTNHVLFS